MSSEVVKNSINGLFIILRKKKKPIRILFHLILRKPGIFLSDRKSWKKLTLLYGIFLFIDKSAKASWKNVSSNASLLLDLCYFYLFTTQNMSPDADKRML